MTVNRLRLVDSENEIDKNRASRYLLNATECSHEANESFQPQI